jgi:hypothetical protein
MARPVHPYRIGDRPGYVLSFVHPEHGKLTRGLATTDPLVAEAIANDVRRLLARTDVVKQPEKHMLDWAGFHRKAVELVLGRDSDEVARLREMGDANPDCSPDSVGIARDSLGFHWQDEALNRSRRVHTHGAVRTVPSVRPVPSLRGSL